MANPQPDEFTRISNELFEAILLSDFTKRQLKIIFLVIRLSYGCGKKYALLRKSDFGIAGIDKSDIKKELDYLIISKVLSIDGDQISLNKDYDRWRVSLVHSGENFKKLIRHNVNEIKNIGETPTPATEIVGNLPTCHNMELAKYQLRGWQNTNLEVGKIPTEQDTQPYSENGLGGAERKGKENKEKSGTTSQAPIKKTETIEDILARFPRYNNGQWTTIRQYWDTIRFTRRTGKVADSIVAREMEYWERFTVEVVLESLEIHMRKYQSKREDYTAGIMRRLVNDREKGGQPHGREPKIDPLAYKKNSYYRDLPRGSDTGMPKV